MTDQTFSLFETTIAQLRDAYETLQLSPVEVTARYLSRIAAFDRAGGQLNALVVLNPDMFKDAVESARRYREGTARPLEGMPYTIKDSYMAKGLTVAAGSPAFVDLVATGDAFSVAQLRAAGAILIGKTNMPSMADGGMQRGVYGRAENPYNPNYLAAAYASGSSNGSGVATASNFSVFGMGEETVSSGRSPASNNALCAYTPSWGVISIRGNWPLFPSRDVVVPHTRTMGDMLTLLDVLVDDDEKSVGDFWRWQNAVEIPPASQLRPESYRELFDARGAANKQPLAEKRYAAPRMYLGKDPKFPIDVHPGVLARWERAVQLLEELGAEVVETDFPVVEKYEGDKPASEQLEALGLLPDGWVYTEFTELLAWGWDSFLRELGDEKLPSLAHANPDLILKFMDGTLPDRYEEDGDQDNRGRTMVDLATKGMRDPREREDFARGLRSLVQIREQYFDSWLQENGFDAVVFPANADVGRESADRDIAAADHAWQNGVLFSNGNYVFRHLGIPTVTVPMGLIDPIGVPVGLSFAGAAYADADLLAQAAAFEAGQLLRGELRDVPRFAPPQPEDKLQLLDGESGGEAHIAITRVSADIAHEAGVAVKVTCQVDQVPDGGAVVVTVNEASAEVRVTEPGEIIAQLVVAHPVPTRNQRPARLLCIAELRTARGVAADFADESLEAVAQLT